MLRSAFKTRILNYIGDGNEDFDTDFNDWLDEILLEIQSFNNVYWDFLQASTIYNTVNNTNTVSFSTLGIDGDFSKGLTISSSLVPLALDPLPKESIDSVLGSDTGNPIYFSRHNSNLYFFPTPVTGNLPVLTLKYYKDISLPTDDSDDVNTVTGMNDSWNQIIIKGLKWKALDEIDDIRVTSMRRMFEQGVLSMAQNSADIIEDDKEKFDRKNIPNVDDEVR